VCSPLFPSIITHSLTCWLVLEMAAYKVKCTSHHLIALPARFRSQGQSFIAVRRLRSNLARSHLLIASCCSKRILRCPWHRTSPACRGNHPALPIADFYSATIGQQFAPAQTGVVGAELYRRLTARGRRSSRARSRHQTNTCPRSLALWPTSPGMRPPGYFSAGETHPGHQTSLGEIQRLDRTLFVRVAGLTFDKLGWMNRGEMVVLHN
jgi:hypothetical protein